MPPVLLLIDCWGVHLRSDFIAYVKERLSRSDVWVPGGPAAEDGVPGDPDIGVIIMFVPAGCTGKMQPLDVAIQKMIKDFVRKAWRSFLLERVRAQLAEGIAPGGIR